MEQRLFFSYPLYYGTSYADECLAKWPGKLLLPGQEFKQGDSEFDTVALDIDPALIPLGHVMRLSDVRWLFIFPSQGGLDCHLVKNPRGRKIARYERFHIGKEHMLTNVRLEVMLYYFVAVFGHQHLTNNSKARIISGLLQTFNFPKRAFRFGQMEFVITKYLGNVRVVSPHFFYHGDACGITANVFRTLVPA